MKTQRPVMSLLAVVALLTGCATQRELIEQRISQKAAFFATLPAEDQQRLRDGTVRSGDPRDAAWIVYGKPDRIFQKETATSTNEVWSYVAQDLAASDELHPVYHPVNTSGGRTLWRPVNLAAADIYNNSYEYRRIEFQDGRVLSLEAERP